jgi:hypothetical protein
MNKPVMLDAGPFSLFVEAKHWREIIPLPLPKEEDSDGSGQDSAVESTD